MATQPQLGDMTITRKAKRQAQQHVKHRAWKTAVRSMVGLVVATACGEIAHADIQATPHARISFNPKTNQVQVQLVAGQGWLANWVVAHSTLQARAEHGDTAQSQNLNSSTAPTSSVTTLKVGTQTWNDAVKPSETVRVSTRVTGPLLHKPTANQTIHVPVAPTVTGTHHDAKTETLSLNTPIATIKLLSGNHKVTLKSAKSVTLTRETNSYMAKLQFVAVNGETASTSVHVPALALPPPKPATSTPSVDTKLVPPVSPVPEYFFGSASGNRVYITIDDGWYPDPQVLTLMQQTHVPLTAFLIDAAAQEHLAYWKSFVAAGGTIGDHTDTHPFLTHLSAQTDVYQWKKPVMDDQKWFGVTPLVGRPPYGDVNKTVLEAAHAAGLKAVVMWSAEFNPSDQAKGLETWNGQPLEAGEIVLLHWQPGLYSELKQVLAICKAEGLVPAPLTSGLPATGGK